MLKFFNNKKYSISRLDKIHQKEKFSCGIDLLDNYLHKQATQDYHRHISVTYILNDKESNQVAGYYTLSSTSIELADLPDKLKSKLPQYPLLPATLIGRLAVDLNYQKQTLGEVLLIDALKKAYQNTNEVASIAVAVDAINDSAINFYKKYGFLPMLSNGSKLYLPMKTIEKLLT
ncbi:GNAT family N-acetyltransferase [Legionella cincinnatiensis]|uniref:N-acetyltransferase GCN5 n=1 Tax=Legionella cincinnatiensis TaxID=28085 RepID=A0A378IIE9_9GAMM|nr:GNAT family N-acetyltransferase [Legionella cincinnatiensis]KTC91775.1 N-acetyltransferase GCN5 [Legionella cincinnatiensis]STX34522.1 N-acetyltransferase GCN5 [Legionella cincinnatiensis]